MPSHSPRYQESPISGIFTWQLDTAQSVRVSPEVGTIGVCPKCPVRGVVSLVFVPTVCSIWYRKS